MFKKQMIRLLPPLRFTFQSQGTYPPLAPLSYYEAILGQDFREGLNNGKKGNAMLKINLQCRFDTPVLHHSISYRLDIGNFGILHLKSHSAHKSCSCQHFCNLYGRNKIGMDYNQNLAFVATDLASCQNPPYDSSIVHI